MSQELKSCAHCGGEARLTDGTGFVPVHGAFIGCVTCEITTPIFGSVAEAITAWNRRPPEQSRGDEARDEMKAYPNCGSCREWCGCDAWPVLIQKRMRPTWEPDGRGWTAWEDCTEESAQDCERMPINGDWQYEVRRLYADPAKVQVDSWNEGYKAGIEKGRKDPAMHEAKYLEGYRAALSRSALGREG